jgi:hypothetical protein
LLDRLFRLQIQERLHALYEAGRAFEAELLRETQRARQLAVLRDAARKALQNVESAYKPLWELVSTLGKKLRAWESLPPGQEYQRFCEEARRLDESYLESVRYLRQAIEHYQWVTTN